tara:strand:+ start:2125 stop:3162 length:1038 start_codon:yes stop_codon:yes gene_type:complete
MSAVNPTLQYPFDSAPQAGQRLEIAPGVYWLYFPLPFALDHINLWLLADGDGWTLVDTGFSSAHTRGIWETVFRDALDGKPIHRIVVTHYHPDHIGQAGWLAERFAAPVLMTRGEWDLTTRIHQASDAQVGNDFRAFFGLHGLEGEDLEAMANRGNTYRRIMPELPPTPEFIAGGDTLTVNGDAWRILIGRGHAPEHACLYRERDRVLISGDQVLPKISSNLSVRSHLPDEDAVGEFTGSLKAIKAELPEDTLVAPAHGLPFHGLHQRIDALCGHHEEQLDAALQVCRAGPTTAFDLLPVLFRRELDSHQTMFAMSESIAHLNSLMARGDVQRQQRQGRLYFSAA